MELTTVAAVEPLFTMAPAFMLARFASNVQLTIRGEALLLCRAPALTAAL